MRYYLHIWFDEYSKKKFIDEQNLKSSFEDAKDDFEYMRDTFKVQYIETHFIDTESGTCKIINMQNEIWLNDDDLRKKAFIDWQSDDGRKYA